MVRPLSVVFLEFFGIPCSWNDVFVEVFEVVGSRFGLHPDSVRSLLVGGEFPFFRIFLVASEDEIANLEFSVYHLFVVSDDNLLF